jgi:hypothetical protein
VLLGNGGEGDARDLPGTVGRGTVHAILDSDHGGRQHSGLLCLFGPNLWPSTGTGYVNNAGSELDTSWTSFSYSGQAR